MKILSKLLFVNLGLLIFAIDCYGRGMSAGVLPYAHNEEGVLCFLLGQEPNGLWADFGGKADRHEKHTHETAAREFSEETRYVYGRYSLLKHHHNKDVYIRPSAAFRESKRYILRRLREKLFHPKRYYVMYLAHVDYILAQDFTCAPKVPHYEKKAYEWVPVAQLLSEISNATDREHAYVNGMKVRPPFYDTVIYNYDTIGELVHQKRPVHSPKHRTMKAARTH